MVAEPPEVTIARLDERTKAMHELLLSINANAEKQNGRTRRLENWQGRIIGGLSVLALFVTLFGGILVKHLIP